MTKNKVYHLTIKSPQLPTYSLTLTLTSPNQRGDCFKCHLEKEIVVVSEKPAQFGVYEERKFCWTCALINLTELAQSNDEFDNKKATIKEIRTILLAPPISVEENQELLECYD